MRIPRVRHALVALALAGAPAAAAAAQATVHGTVYDSLAHAPLAGATVQLVSSSDEHVAAQSTTSDSLGRFAFRDVSAGRYLVGFLHPLLDSLGIDAPVRGFEVVDARDVRIDLAIPSTTQVRRAVCGPSADSSDGLLIGSVRGARDDRAVAHAAVVARWREYSITTHGITGRSDTLAASTTANGWFALCGVPAGGSMVVLASHASDSTDAVEIAIPADGIVRKTLYVGSTRGADSVRITGTVLAGVSGAPIAGAQVRIANGAEARTDERGAWSISAAASGTRSIEVRALGYYPDRATVDVWSEAAPVVVKLSTMKAVLDTVKIIASGRRSSNLAAFERRRRSTGGTFITEQQLARLGGVRASDLFRSLPRVVLRQGFIFLSSTFRDSATHDYLCSPSVWVDDRYMYGEPPGISGIGGVSLFQIDNWVRRDEVAGIEIYSETTVPLQYQLLDKSHCGAIVIWTK